MRYFWTALGAALFISVISQPATAQRESQQRPDFRQQNPTYKKNKLRRRKYRQKRTRIRTLSFSEYGQKKPDYKIFEKKIDQIKEREIVRLDLTIRSHPARFQEGTPCKGNDWGAVRTTNKSSYHFLPVPKNYHIIFQLLPGTSERFPFSSVSCVYNPTTPGRAYMRFSGYFVAHHHIVPTAVIHEFRAITPPASMR